MGLVVVVVGRSILRSATVMGGMLIRLSLMCTKPKRKSLTSVGEKRCVSFTLKKRPWTGISYGKFKSVALMLLANVPPSEACKPPAPNGSHESESEKQNRAAILS